MRVCECDGTCSVDCLIEECSGMARAYLILRPFDFYYKPSTIREATGSDFGAEPDDIVMLCDGCGACWENLGEMLMIRHGG